MDWSATKLDSQRLAAKLNISKGQQTRTYPWPSVRHISSLRKPLICATNRSSAARSPRLTSLPRSTGSVELVAEIPRYGPCHGPETQETSRQRPRQLAPSQSASASCRVLSRHLAHHSRCRPPSAPRKAPADRPQPPVYPNSSPDYRACNSLTPLPLSSRRPSVDSG